MRSTSLGDTPERLSSRLVSTALSIVVAALAVWAIMLVVDAPPVDAVRELWDGSLGRVRKIPSVLLAWVPLTLAAAGLIVTFRAGMWNIGVEGQIVMGAIGAALVARTLPGPGLVGVAVAFLVGGAFGALWASIPGALRTRYDVHEIFSGVALNFVAGAIALYLIVGPWSRSGVASTGGTDTFDTRFDLPVAGADEWPWLGGLVAVAAVVVTGVVMARSRYGLRLKAVGKNPKSAHLLGINTGRHLMSAFAVCGALAGVAGVVQALGFHHKLVPSVSGGYGFTAILVVLLAGFRVRWLMPIALFFAAMAVGSTQLALRLQIDSALAGVVQGVLVLSILLTGGVLALLERRRH
jgi:simple sugar transport system permease protein